MRLFAVAVIAGALLFSAPATAKPGIQVVGGEVSQDKYQWIVSIEGTPQRGGQPAHVCGGSLIAARWVLTAAHCLDLAQSAGYPVRIGDRDAVAVKARQGIRHPAYDPLTLSNDIGLLELAEPVTGITPVALQNFDMWETAAARTLGWGVFDNVTADGSTQLRQDDSEVIQPASCAWAAGVFHADQMYCFSSEQGSPCLFDSGGPVLSKDPATSRWRLTAIVAGGDTYCPHGTDYPWFGINVGQFRSWITSITGLLHAPGPF